MKNIIVIDADNWYSCDLVSSVNDGTNSLFLEIKADTSNNPILEIQEESIPISDSDFIYQIASELFIGDGEITFRIIDDSQTSEYFHISKINALDGNMFLKQISDYAYSLSIQPKVSGGGSCECKVDDELSLISENPVQNKVITARLDEVFTSVSDGKSLIASAITDKGISTDNDATFQQMADNIQLINGSYGLCNQVGIIEFTVNLISYGVIGSVGITETE